MCRLLAPLCASLTLVVSCCVLSARPALAVTGVSWGSTQEIPGLAALNKGARIEGVTPVDLSCASAGNCAAVADDDGDNAPIVAGQVNGVWGNWQAIPGASALYLVNGLGYADVSAVSCPSAGQCTVAGDYYPGNGAVPKVFVDNEVSGAWQTARQLPGLAALEPDGDQVNALSCWSPRNCAVIGQGFVATETAGTWGAAEAIPGAAALSSTASATTLSCAAGGVCAIGGFFSTLFSSGAIVVYGTAGNWQNAQEVPGDTSLPGFTEGGQVTSVSCAADGSCTAVGEYSATGTTSGGFPVFAGLADFSVTETAGVWADAATIPGAAALPGGGDPVAVSCASAGNCTVGGNYYGTLGGSESPWADNETGGSWGTVTRIASGNGTSLASLSCWSAGNCAAVGSIASSGAAFVADQTGGSWSPTERVPGSSKYTGARAVAVSCTSAGDCALLGGVGNAPADNVPVIFTAATSPSQPATPASAAKDTTDATAAGRAASSAWTAALQVPGAPSQLPSAIDTGVVPTGLSCASPGNCVAIASNGSGIFGDPLVDDEINGTWGGWQVLPGISALEAPPRDGSAQVTAVSCPTAGNCVVTGNYRDFEGQQEFDTDGVFTSDQLDGVWQAARAVTAAGSFEQAGGILTDVTGLSCWSPGNCLLAGGSRVAFAASESNGQWGPAQQVPGLGLLDLNLDNDESASMISCGPEGDCVVGGAYFAGWYIAVDDEGTWNESAGAVPGTVTSISCTSAKTCTVVGDSTGSGTAETTYVLSGKGENWSGPVPIPGTAALGTNGAAPSAVSCAAPGDCSVVGRFFPAGAVGAWADTEKNGSWGTALKVPGVPAADTDASLTALSCGLPGDCSAVGTEGMFKFGAPLSAVVTDEKDGTWGKVGQIPGTGPYADAIGNFPEGVAVSCVNSADCTLLGGLTSVTDASTLSPSAFLSSRSLPPTTTRLSVKSATSAFGNEQADPISATVTGPGGTPGGTVTVTSGATTVCVITLHPGTVSGTAKGTCTPAATKLPVGLRELTGGYSGSTALASSDSVPIALTIAKSVTTTSLAGRHHDDLPSVSAKATLTITN